MIFLIYTGEVSAPQEPGAEWRADSEDSDSSKRVSVDWLDGRFHSAYGTTASVSLGKTLTNTGS